MNYELMAPPFEMKEFDEMNKKEAKEHFEWYINEIPNRIEILKNIYEEFGGKKENLDYSINSLEGLWKWYLKNVEIIDKSEKEILDEKSELPEWLKDEEIIPKKISITWLAIAMDISMYLGEVFVRNNPQLKWTFITKPKRIMHVNRPVIGDFKNDKMDTRHILYILTLKIIKHTTDEKALLNLYNVWMEYLE